MLFAVVQPQHFSCLCQCIDWKRYVSGVFVHLCVSPKQTLLAQYLGYLLMVFDQIFTTNGL